MGVSEPHSFMRRLLHAHAKTDGMVMTVRITTHPVDALYWMLPTLAHLSHTDRWSVWLSPPFHLDSVFFRDMGFNLGHTRVVHGHGNRGCDVHLIEQALGCPANAVVLAWPQQWDSNDISLAQQAARAGNSFGLLFLSDPPSKATNRLSGTNPPRNRRPTLNMTRDWVSIQSPSC